METMLKRVLISLVSVWAIVYIANQIFVFFGIGFETYGIYMLWVIAIMLLYSFLPPESGLIFMPKEARESIIHT